MKGSILWELPTLTSKNAEPGGFLSDYVLFYFAPRSPMLYAIHRGAVEGYAGTQRKILHLVSSNEAVIASGLPFVFTDGHAEVMFSDFFTNLVDLNRVDWQIMSEKMWTDTNKDLDRKRRRQAEFLVHQFFPWTLISEIGVIDNAMASRVKELIEPATYRPNVVVQPA